MRGSSRRVNCALEEERDLTVLRVLAFSQYEEGDLDAVIATARESWNPDSNEPANIHLAEVLLRAYADQGDEDAAATVAATLREKWPIRES